MEQKSRIDELLARLIQIIGRVAMPEEKVAEIIGQRRAQLRAFNMCDGRRTQGEIARKLRLHQSNLSRTFARWVDSGIAFRIGDGKEARLLHIYPLPATRGAGAKVKTQRKGGRRAVRRK